MPQELNLDRACDRCRERRVKCDKRRPECQRCEKLGKPCPGYAKKRKFVDEGVLLRRKFEHGIEATSPWNGSVQPARSAPSPTQSQQTFFPARSSDILWPRNGGKQGVEMRYENSEGRSLPRPASSSTFQSSEVLPLSRHVFTRGLPEIKSNDDLLDDYMKDATFDPEWFDLEPASYYNKAGNSCGFLPSAQAIVDEVDRDDNMYTLGSIKSVVEADVDDSLNFWAGESQLQTSQLLSDQREHEMAYLIRHFCDNVGPWMDLFDAERHFAQLVPLKALRDALLKNAIAAVSAKQLGCINGGKPYVARQCQRPASMETIDAEMQVDWFYKAANYYDKAIMYSRVYLQALSGSLSAPPSPSISSSLTAADSDDLLLAVSIFSLYEYLDNADLGWIQHLTGLKTILSILTPSPISQPLELDSVALGRRASFWNFARADYQAAYINKTATLLNTDDLPMWLDCGLQIKPGGALYHEPQALAQDRGALSHTNELVARTLLWVILRIMNHLVTSQQDVVRQRAEWEQLSATLDSWQAARPKSFQPCARLRNPVSRGVITELFYSIPLCAATVQLYHFARLLLLLNKPVLLGSGTSGEKAKHELDEVLSHAYTIIGIALSRPCQAVRVEMLLPLHLAGSCLRADEERRIVLDLLSAIQKDTGCEAGGRMKDLTKAWGWPSMQIAVA